MNTNGIISTTDMNLLILHLSDLHIRTETDAILGRGDAIARAIFKELPLADTVVVLFTGDIAFGGKSTEYALARNLVSDIVTSIRAERDVPVHVLMCPGNHDCDFDLGSPDVRDIVIEKIRTSRQDDIKETLIDECSSVQANFFKFRDEIAELSPLYVHKLWQSYKIELKNKSVIFHFLNVAWMSQEKEKQGVLAFPTKRFETAATTKADTTIVCMHHPLNWFSQTSYRPLRQLVRKSAHLVLTGHEHEQSVSCIDDIDSGESISVDGGVMQETGKLQSRFNLVFLDIEKQEYSVSFHDWDGSRYMPVELDSSWSSFRRLPEKKQNDFSVSAEFSRYLDDAGARFTHHGKITELDLADVFVYPEMRPLDGDEKGRLFIDSAKLRSPENLKRGALIRGREQYGKTSLLKQLFRNYHARGYLPLLVSGKAVSKSTPRDIQKMIESSVANIYGKSAVPLFWQVGTEKRVLLLDDIDESSLSGEYFSRALENLGKNFSLLVITCSEMFELRQLVVPEDFDVLKKLDHYELLEFGNRRRHDLIKRWVHLGDGAVSVDTLVGLIDQAEGLVLSILGSGVVPSTPFFILTLLQSIETGTIANLQHSALGEYYRYLIIHSLELQGVSREEHNEILNYCGHLAWFICKSAEARVLSENFARFHDAFVELHGLSLEFKERLELLTATKLVDRQDGAFGFRYPYLYYFFLGMYLAEHLEGEDVQGVIRGCCERLHTQENGNIILFLAHHSRDKRVYESVLAVMQGHFSKHQPMNLDNDVDVVNRLVDSTPSLIYEERDVLKNRAELCDWQDEQEKANQLEMTNLDALPPEVIAIMSLLRTVDILGQFLKNHYGQLSATVKESLLKELFDGGLRGLREFLEMLFAASDGLIGSIEAVLEKRGIEDDPIRRNARAKREMYGLLEMIACAFIRRSGVSVASPHLSRVIENVVDKNPTTANRLILSAIELEKQGALESLEKLRVFNKEIKSNAFAQSILQELVLIHMHLYPTTAMQKQKICAELNIELRETRALDYKTRDHKRVTA